MKMEPSAMEILFEFFNAIFAAELPALFEHFESIGMLPQLYHFMLDLSHMQGCSTQTIGREAKTTML